MLADKTAAAGNERLHERPLAKNQRKGLFRRGRSDMRAARSRLKPRATKSFATINIGLMSICIGLSSNAGRRSSQEECPTICNAQPTTKSVAVVAHIHATPTCLVIVAAVIRSGTTAQTIPTPIARSRTIQKISAGMTKRAAALVRRPTAVTDTKLDGSAAAKNRSGVPIMCRTQLRGSR